ncbi:MAG: penicillin-binding transpeptidase domain-containing protein [Acidobacteriota bacterium]
MTTRFERPGQRRAGRRLVLWLVLVGTVSGGTWVAARWRVGSLIRAAQAELSTANPAAATAFLEAADFWRVRRAQVAEARGALALVTGDLPAAETTLTTARAAGLHRSGLDLDHLGRLLCDRALYRAVMTFADHREATGGGQLPDLWRAEAALADNDLEAATGWLSADRSAGNDPARARRLAALLAARRRQGVAWSVFDRHDRPLLGRDGKNGALRTEIPELGPHPLSGDGVLHVLGDRDLGGRVTLTLDLAYERAAHAALGGYAGAFVAIDPETGGILALVDHPSPGATGSPAVRREYEPGSIVKMLTLAAALDTQLDMDSLFPLNCTGNMTLDHKVFYDWTVHGMVAGIDAATAQSCNLAFAAIGLELGQARLDDTLHRFGFDATPPGTDLDVVLGRTTEIDAGRPRLGLASRSVGLGTLTMTPLHVALVAAGLANGGVLMQPHLVASRTSLGGDAAYATTEPVSWQTGTSPGSARRIGEAMLHVVTDPLGTGRRAAIDGLDFVMKTGTAGERRAGLNTVVLGWAPATDPVVAFGFVAEHAGKAELEGTRILRDFLTTVRNEFPARP